MRSRLFQVLGTFLALALFAPAGFLFSKVNQPKIQFSSSSANWADVAQASHLFNQIQILSQKVAHEIGPIQAEETNLFWRGQANELNQVRDHVNQMGEDLSRLSQMRNRLEPWQQKLLNLMTPDIHELVYQTRAAIHVLNSQHNKLALFATSYPQNVTIISNTSGHLENSIGTFTQAAQSAKKLAALERQTRAPKTNG